MMCSSVSSVKSSPDVSLTAPNPTPGPAAVRQPFQSALAPEMAADSATGLQLSDPAAPVAGSNSISPDVNIGSLPSGESEPSVTLAFASGESFSDLGPSSFDLSIPESIKRGAAKARILPKDLTQKMLRGALSYDAKTGFFIWKISPVGSVAVGSAAGSINGRGYIQIRLFGSRYTAHRLAWLYERGYLPDQHLDHIDGVRSNNALVNLREATLSQNQHNSPARGYSWDKNEEKYRSSITINGKRTFLGYFDSADDARAAFLSAHARLAGEFSFTRRPTANIAPFARGA